MGEMKRGAEGTARPPAGKQPYEKPAVVWQESLELRPGLIVACNKVALQDAFCDLSPSS